MQICKTCRTLMIGEEASDWLPRLKHMLRHHGAARETLAVVADALGPMCDKCRKATNKWIEEP